MTTHEKLRRAALAILDELEDRYDGAPDSDVLWMGDHIRELREALTPVDDRGNEQ
jgi:hypothetical protein